MGKVRSWKSAATVKGSASTVGPAAHTSWAQREVDEQIRQQKKLAQERREEKEKRKEENKAKGLQYQVISDSRKLKKMSRKQLKLIRKADTTGPKPLLAAESKKRSRESSHRPT